MFSNVLCLRMQLLFAHPSRWSGKQIIAVFVLGHRSSATCHGDSLPLMEIENAVRSFSNGLSVPLLQARSLISPSVGGERVRKLEAFTSTELLAGEQFSTPYEKMLTKYYLCLVMVDR
ncbi:hypothetical protein CDAR_95161 [Caerostris darwini]|uniref:Uncharacterized protein n=1 Tax=Caerostris darwini TaxID=1538125 RepID=A0AAV4PJ24_9ARAC|nr:hypothetical protein CDAR_95161 [Caerostris darwini]